MGKEGRTSRLSIRLTPEEYKHFLIMQRNSGLSQADFIMRAIDSVPMPDERVLEQYSEVNEKLAELNELVKNIKPKT